MLATRCVGRYITSPRDMAKLQPPRTEPGHGTRPAEPSPGCTPAMSTAHPAGRSRPREGTNSGLATGDESGPISAAEPGSSRSSKHLSRTWSSPETALKRLHRDQIAGDARHGISQSFGHGTEVARRKTLIAFTDALPAVSPDGRRRRVPSYLRPRRMLRIGAVCTSVSHRQPTPGPVAAREGRVRP